MDIHPNHRHTGTDSLAISFGDLTNRQQAIWWTIPGTQAATATNYATIFIAPFPCTLVQAFEVHATAGTDGSAVTLQVEKLTGTTAAGSGTSLLSSAFNLKGTANTVQEASIVQSSTNGVRNATLQAGDRLALKKSGTLTSVANVTVLFIVQY